MKSKFKRHAIMMAATSLIAVHAASAANSLYSPGDLVLFFQKTGSTNTIYANLGNAATVFRGAAAGTDAASMVNFLDLSTTLTSAFGSGWASDPTIYAGLAGVNGTNPTNNTLVNGDPQRTLYISAGRNSVGTIGTADSTGWDLTIAGNTAMTTASGGIQQMNNPFAAGPSQQVGIFTTDVSQIDDQNPFLSPGIQGNAMAGTLQGGIQQPGNAGIFGNYAATGDVEFALDLYRVLGKNNISGQVAGGLRVGSFEGTVTVGSNGMVSYLVPEPSSTLMLGFAAGSLLLRRRRSA